MKKLQRIVLAAAALSLVLGLALTAVSEAQPGPRGRRAGDADAPAMAPRGLARLDLTDAQKDQLNEMRLENRRQALLRRGEMASLRAQLQAEFLNDDVDEGKVRSLSKKISALRSQADEARLEHRLAMMNLLTDEQREQFKEMRWNGPGHGMRGGPGLHRGRGGRGMQGGPGLHRGRGGRGMRGGPGLHRGPCGEGQDFGGGPRGALDDGPFGGEGGGFFGDADPGQGFGPWWLDPGAGPEEGPAAAPAPEDDAEEIY